MCEKLYRAKFTHAGSMVNEFIDEGIIIIFNSNAPKELAEISFLHNLTNINKDVCPGDTIQLGYKKFAVTAVGSEANKTLKSMGHCTFCFNGAVTTNMPGQIELIGESIPKLKVGSKFEIIFQNGN